MSAVLPLCIVLCCLTIDVSAQRLLWLPTKPDQARPTPTLAAFDDGVLLRIGSVWSRSYLLRTTDDGHSWSFINQYAEINPRYLVVSKSALYVLDKSDQLWSSLDQGRSFQRMPMPISLDPASDTALRISSDQDNDVILYSAKHVWRIRSAFGEYSPRISVPQGATHVEVIEDGTLIAELEDGVHYVTDPQDTFRSLFMILLSRGRSDLTSEVVSNRLMLTDPEFNTFVYEGDSIRLFLAHDLRQSPHQLLYVDDEIVFSSDSLIVLNSRTNSVRFTKLFTRGAPIRSLQFVARTNSARYLSFDGHVFKLESFRPVIAREAWYAMSPLRTLTGFLLSSTVIGDGSLLTTRAPAGCALGRSYDGGLSWHGDQRYPAGRHVSQEIGVDPNGKIYMWSDTCLVSTDTAATFIPYAGEYCRSSVYRIQYHRDGTKSVSSSSFNGRSIADGEPFEKVSLTPPFYWTLLSERRAIALDSMLKTVYLASEDGKFIETIGQLDDLPNARSYWLHPIRVNDDEVAFIRYLWEDDDDTCDVWLVDLRDKSVRKIYTSTVLAHDVARPPGWPLMLIKGDRTILEYDSLFNSRLIIDSTAGVSPWPDDAVGSIQFHYNDHGVFIIDAYTSSHGLLLPQSTVSSVSSPTGLDQAAGSRTIITHRHASCEIVVSEGPIVDHAAFWITDVTGRVTPLAVTIAAGTIHFNAPAVPGVYCVSGYNGRESTWLLLVQE